MIELGPELLVGRGLHRECYQHPQDPGLCVKVLMSARGQSEASREEHYLTLLRRRGISWSALPRFHGTVETNAGKGWVFDLIRDEDGPVSATLHDYLKDEEKTEAVFSGLKKALPELKETLVGECIVTMNIKAKNIVYCRSTDASGRLVVIDNIGNSDYIPIADYLPFWARLKTRRKWTRFQSRLVHEYAGNALVPALLGDRLSG